MRVFVLTINEVYDYEEFTHKPRVFATLKNARKAKDEFVNNFKRTVDLTDTIDGDEWVEDITDNTYDAYIDGRYAENHYRVTIQSVEVQ